MPTGAQAGDRLIGFVLAALTNLTLYSTPASLSIIRFWLLAAIPLFLRALKEILELLF